MMATLLLLFASLAGYSGFACLALAMPEHWANAGGDPDGQATRRHRLRLSGAMMLCMACAVCIWRDGASFGILLWTLLMSASAIAVTFTLTWYPQLLLRCSRASVARASRSSWHWGRRKFAASQRV
jgi:hypothetical protein